MYARSWIRQVFQPTHLKCCLPVNLFNLFPQVPDSRLSTRNISWSHATRWPL